MRRIARERQHKVKSDQGQMAEIARQQEVEKKRKAEEARERKKAKRKQERFEENVKELTEAEIQKLTEEHEELRQALIDITWTPTQPEDASDAPMLDGKCDMHRENVYKPLSRLAKREWAVKEYALYCYCTFFCGTPVSKEKQHLQPKAEVLERYQNVFNPLTHAAHTATFLLHALLSQHPPFFQLEKVLCDHLVQLSIHETFMDVMRTTLNTLLANRTEMMRDALSWTQFPSRNVAPSVAPLFEYVQQKAILRLDEYYTKGEAFYEEGIKSSQTRVNELFHVISEEIPQLFALYSNFRKKPKKAQSAKPTPPPPQGDEDFLS
jgi:flagellar biosynthesis GTPase FlhF